MLYELKKVDGRLRLIKTDEKEKSVISENYEISSYKNRLWLVCINNGRSRKILRLPEADNTRTIKLALIDKLLHKALGMNWYDEKLINIRIAIALLTNNRDILFWDYGKFRYEFEHDRLATENLICDIDTSDDESTQSPFFTEEVEYLEEIQKEFFQQSNLEKAGRFKKYDTCKIELTDKQLVELESINNAIKNPDLPWPRIYIADKGRFYVRAEKTWSQKYSDFITAEDTDDNKNTIWIEITTKFYVAQFRGEHYLLGRWGDEARREHRKAPLFEKERYYCESVMQTVFDDFYETFSRELFQEKRERLMSVSEELSMILRELRNTSFILENNPASGKPPKLHSNVLNWIQHLYTNGIIKLLNTLYQLRQSRWQYVEQLKNAYNPFVSTGDLPDHAIRYGLGEKNPYTRIVMRARYTQTGRPKKPCVGKLNLSIHPLHEFLLERFPNNVRVLRTQGEVFPKTQIDQELETSFLAYIKEGSIPLELKVLFPNFNQRINWNHMDDKTRTYYQIFGLDSKTAQKFGKAFNKAPDPKRLEDLENRIQKKIYEFFNFLLFVYAFKYIRGKECNGVPIYRDSNGTFTRDLPKDPRQDRVQERRRESTEHQKMGSRVLPLLKTNPFFQDIETRKDGRAILYYVVDEELIETTDQVFYRKSESRRQSLEQPATPPRTPPRNFGERITRSRSKLSESFNMQEIRQAINDINQKQQEKDEFLEEISTHRISLANIGWNCFDVAVNIERDKLVQYALNNNTDEFRQLLAPEIRHAAALTAVYMNGCEEVNRERAYKLAKLFNLVEILKGNEKEDVIKQLSRKASELLDKDNLAELEQNILPKSMRIEQLQQLVNAYLKDTNDNVHEQNLQTYCTSLQTYEQYIRDYYGAHGWIVFQQNFSGETSTSMIDIAARMLNKVIIIYQENQEIYRTQNKDTTGEIKIDYNGINHFEKRGTETKAQRAELNISYSTFFRSGNHKESTNCELPQQPDLTQEEIQTNYALELSKADEPAQQISRENLLDEHDLHESDQGATESENDDDGDDEGEIMNRHC